MPIAPAYVNTHATHHEPPKRLTLMFQLDAINIAFKWDSLFVFFFLFVLYSNLKKPNDTMMNGMRKKKRTTNAKHDRDAHGTY